MLLFVGERRSPKAIQMGVHWRDEALAAVPLFEALRACGLDPNACLFVNWFDGDDRDLVRGWSGPVFALGKKVQKALKAECVAHIPLIHPAARGSIRLRANYIAHVRQAIKPLNDTKESTHVETEG
jgi:hypothetical protein